jgi:hypothetical protein
MHRNSIESSEPAAHSKYVTATLQPASERAIIVYVVLYILEMRGYTRTLPVPAGTGRVRVQLCGYGYTRVLPVLFV